jgi:hypothetical protein
MNWPPERPSTGEDDLMSQSDLNRAVRHARHARQLGSDPHCATCGSREPVSLVKPTAKGIATPQSMPSAKSSRAPSAKSASTSPSTPHAKSTPSAKSAPSRTPHATLCYECLLIQHGKSSVETHHLLGQANDPSTVDTLGNLHRALTDSQQDWPEEVRHNTHRNPLWWLAGIFYSLHDYLAWLLRTCRKIGDLLVQIGHWAEQQGGTQWWAVAGVAIP